MLIFLLVEDVSGPTLMNLRQNNNVYSCVIKKIFLLSHFTEFYYYKQ